MKTVMNKKLRTLLALGLLFAVLAELKLPALTSSSDITISGKQVEVVIAIAPLALLIPVIVKVAGVVVKKCAVVLKHKTVQEIARCAGYVAIGEAITILNDNIGSMKGSDLE